MKTDENVSFGTLKKVMSSSCGPGHYRDAKIIRAVTGLIVMSLFHEKLMCVNARRGPRALAVCVAH